MRAKLTQLAAAKARVRQLRTIPTAWILDYALGRIYRYEERLMRRRVKTVLPSHSGLFPALRDALGIDEDTFDKGMGEFQEIGSMRRQYLAKPGTADPELAYALYIITRWLKPGVVVETGVWHGVSSWAILAALDKVGKGKLVSIDLPPLNPDTRVKVGGAVPDHLKGRWELHVGPSRLLLARILHEESPISVFLHDSAHVYRNMMKEFRSAWTHLAPGGVLISDDVHANDAYLDFSSEVGRSPVLVPRTKGGCIGFLTR